MKNRVVVTGMGAVTALGNDVKETWSNIKNGKCAIAPITAFDTTDNKVKIAAEVNIDITDHIPKKETRRMDRFTQFAVIAAREALADCGITAENTDLTRAGTLVSSGIGGMRTIETEQSRGLERGFDNVNPFFIPMTISNIAAGTVAINSGFRGYSACPVTACAGGSYAIGDAFRLIRHGYLDAALCGGADSCITPLGVGGFTSIRAICENNDPTRASIPFDKERSGFVIGEGAGILVLEELSHAQRRGAKIYGEIVGYGATCDAYHITAIAPNGEGGALAMRMALDDSGLAPTDIGYLNAHGTSTILNDKCESAAIKTVFGPHTDHLPVSSTKSMIGHSLGAAGAIEAIVSLLAIQDSFIPPTINYKVPDEECPLDVVPNVGRPQKIAHALSNSFGFGGHNASLIFAPPTE